MLHRFILRHFPLSRTCVGFDTGIKNYSSNVQSRQTAQYVKPQKRKGVIDRSKHFVDYIEVIVQGGNGGNGMISFTSLPKLEWAGPDGGNGGNGGHVIFKVSHNAKSLAHLRPVIAAPKGVNGKTKQRDGKNAQHLNIEVPLGTVIKTKTGNVLASLDDNDSMFIAARGGGGGKGNYFFLSNENRAPNIAESGGLGQQRELHVELKIMAHAGLIGFPNAGKSSLLRAISRAQPKVSPYPFTTLNPHIGMVLYDDHEQLAVADIPGLIPGSHLNKGMGHSFLRHIERCLCLIYVVDLALDKPWQQLLQLQYELNQYRPGLANRPALLVANKVDLPGASDRMDRLRRWMERETGRINTKGGGNSIQQKKEFCILSGFDSLDNDLSKEIIGESKYVDHRSRSSDNLLHGKDDNNRKLDKSEIKMESPVTLTQKLEDDNSEVQKLRITINESKEERNSDLQVIGVSAKRGDGIETLLHHLRVIYDSHLSSLPGNKSS